VGHWNWLGRRVPLQLVMGISPSSNGRQQMVLNGIVVLARLLLKMDISPASNGRERMDVTGTLIHLKQHAVTMSCSITFLMKGALDYPIPGGDFSVPQ